MTPISDERREVAARLRAYPWALTKYDHTDPLKWVGDVMYDEGEPVACPYCGARVVRDA